MKYFVRAVKYAVKLVVLLGVVFWLMRLSGTSNLGAEGGFAEFWSAFFATTRGWIFVAAVIVWCAVYPAVEFVKRHLSYDLATRRGAVVKAMEAGGYKVVSESDGEMVFRGESTLRRVWWLGEEAVTVRRNPTGGIDIEGPRRFASEAQNRIPNYVEQEKA